MVIGTQQQPQQSILVLNIYNPPTESVWAHSTDQRMRLLNLKDTYPTVIARDVNLYHSDWEDMTIEPIVAAKARRNDNKKIFFSLLKVHNYPTFHHHNHLHHSVRDLTVANARAIG